MRKSFLALILILIPLFNSWSSTNSTFFCTSSLDKMATLQNGRVKPLYVHASETFKFLTGKTKFDGLGPSEVYCLLNLKSLGVNSAINFDLGLENVNLRKFLVNDEEKKSISYEEANSRFEEMRKKYMALNDDDSLKKPLGEALKKLQIYSAITHGMDWKIYSAKTDIHDSWISFADFSKLNEEAVNQIKSSTTENTTFTMYEKLKEADETYFNTYGDVYRFEYSFAKARLPVWAFLLNLIALAVFILVSNSLPALGLSGILWLIQVVYMAMRIYISGRAPVTNMYETVLFSGWGALTLALVVGHFSKKKAFIGYGLAYNLLTLMMINFSGGMLSASIGPLVPVLRDNFWLSTHVTTIILSYGALALSWIVANHALIRAIFKGPDAKKIKDASDLSYTCMKFGVVLLAAGIILGGVWADYSWGRFWGWDPKETWSLIALCIYMAVLHGKSTQWIPPRRMIPFTALSFMSILMAWFGVNYILATGLHSYGFSEGGAIFLGTIFLVQTIIVAVAWNRLPDTGSKGNKSDLNSSMKLGQQNS